MDLLDKSCKQYYVMIP